MLCASKQTNILQDILAASLDLHSLGMSGRSSFCICKTTLTHVPQALLSTCIDVKSQHPGKGNHTKIRCVRKIACTNLEAYEALSDGNKELQLLLGMGMAGLISEDFVQ